jgi:hypothetical protein
LAIKNIEPSTTTKPQLLPYVELDLVQVPSQELKTLMVEIMNELGDMQKILNQSYTKLQQNQKQENDVHMETQHKHDHTIVSCKDIKFAHNEIKELHTMKVTMHI